jgi:hypothetical protein
MIAKSLLLACLASTLFMTGLIWFVQVVHYPLFGRVGPAAFGPYHAEHARRTTWVVVVPMVAELVTSALLTAYRPAGTPPALAWAGLAAAALAWASTALVQVPLHGRLSGGFDPGAHRELVLSNAARAAAWTAHAAILLAMTARAMAVAD